MVVVHFSPRGDGSDVIGQNSNATRGVVETPWKHRILRAKCLTLQSPEAPPPPRHKCFQIAPTAVLHVLGSPSIRPPKKARWAVLEICKGHTERQSLLYNWMYIFWPDAGSSTFRNCYKSLLQLRIIERYAFLMIFCHSGDLVGFGTSITPGSGKERLWFAFSPFLEG